MISGWVQWRRDEVLPPLTGRHRRPHLDAERLTRLAIKLLGPRKFDRLGICVGSERGSLNADRQLDAELTRKGPAFGSPSLFVYTLATAPLGEVAIGLGATGPVLSVAAGACSGATALLTAIEWLNADLADAVIAGVSEFEDHAVLFLLEKNGRAQLSGSSSFDPSVPPQRAPLSDLAAALASGSALVLTAVDPLGFQTTLEFAP